MQTRKLSDLKIKNPYLRLDTDVSDLEKSIQAVGMIAPLVITPDNVLLAGARRYQALKNLGVDEAFVTVLDKGELEQELVSIDENLVRKNLDKLEMEGNLRRAKELYEALFPEEEMESETLDEDDQGTKLKSEKLPAQKFLEKVSEKTGLSPKQIHQAINRDSKACDQVKTARKKGELSLSQTNEIIKLDKNEQQVALDHLKTRPVKEIRQFIKMAKTGGVQKAIEQSPQKPHAREFREIEENLKKLLRTVKRLEVEGIELSELPEKTKEIFQEIYERFEAKQDIHNYGTNSFEQTQESLQ